MSKWPSYRFWNGFWNMGRPRVPPLPPYVVMTDRATGVDYYLGQEGDPGSMAVSLNHWDETIRQPFHDYGLDGGPYLAQGTVKLYIDEQTLLAETGNGQISDPRIFTRDAFERHVIELSSPVGWKPGDALIYTEVDL